MSISDSRDFSVDLGSSFTEDAPRPPVPGEEGELVWSDARQQSNLVFAAKNESLKCEGSVATPRRPDLDLGYEPEGSASPTPPYLKWAESLHSLLDDKDGIDLFREFLSREECEDMLDFWLACSGFHKLETSKDKEQNEEKKVKTAKVIYRKYILDNSGIVSSQIKPATKSFIKDCILKHHIDPAMFDQAQTEIQAIIEENSYPLFLKSDIYLEYTRTGGESPKPSSDQKLLIEETAAQHETAPQEGQESRPEPESVLNLSYVNPATSANDSEQQSLSSDADTLSLTDSSLDGVPPYRYRKQHRRKMQESVNANGCVPLPHIPRPNRIPKDIHVDPGRFAAELIRRLEGVQKEREAEEKLDEWLQRVRLEEDGNEPNPVSSMPGFRPPPGGHLQNYTSRYTDMYSNAFLRDAHEENPELILDDHVQRVMRTPGCHSPKSRSPDGLPSGRLAGLPGCSAQGKHPQRHSAKNPHHLHHGYGGKLREQQEGEARGHLHWGADGHYGPKPRAHADNAAHGVTQEHTGYSRGGPCKRGCKKGEEVRGYEIPGPSEDLEKSQKILLWLMDGQKEVVRHKRSPYGSISGCKKAVGHEGLHPCSKERSSSGHTTRNNIQPSHPFIQDPTMPPNPAPNPLTQLEEVCRRLEEENIKSGGAVQPKQRYVMEVIQRGRSAVRPTQCPAMSVVPAVSDSDLSEPEHKASRKQLSEKMTVAYYLCEEPIPYTTSVERGRVVTLGQFKELLTKKGNYRYYFKKVSDEFDCGVVFEEVREDDAVLPIFEEKIIGKVEKIYSNVS